MYTIYETIGMMAVIAGCGFLIARKVKQLKREAVEKAMNEDVKKCLGKEMEKTPQAGGDK